MYRQHQASTAFSIAAGPRARAGGPASDVVAAATGIYDECAECAPADARIVFMISVAIAFAISGGTEFPICRKASFIAPDNTKPSGKDWSRAASRTEIVRAWASS